MIRVAQYNKARKSKYRIRIVLFGTAITSFLLYLTYLMLLELMGRF